jgi:hypothetical protein
MIDPYETLGVLKSVDDRVIQRSGTSSNDVYIYRYWQSFSLINWDFSVDFSVDCKRVRDGFELSSDIATSDGHLLAEFNTLYLKGSIPDVEKQDSIQKWLDELGGFLKSESRNIVRCLVEHKSS